MSPTVWLSACALAAWVLDMRKLGCDVDRLEACDAKLSVSVLQDLTALNVSKAAQEPALVVIAVS